MALAALLPLLGLLGVGAGYNAYAGGNNARDFREKTPLPDMGLLSDPLSEGLRSQHSAAGAGLIRPGEYFNREFGTYGQQADSDEAMSRQQVSSGPAYMNAQLSREQWAVNSSNPDSPTYQPPADPMEAWIAQEQWRRNNPTIDQSLAQERLRMEQDQLAAQQQQAAQAAQTSYIDTVQPVVNRLSAVDTALSTIESGNFDAAWRGTQEGNRVTQEINQIVMSQRSDFWTNNMGRSDAPSESEARALADMFPLIEPGMFGDARRQDLIRQNLLRLKQNLGIQIEDENRRFTATGGQPPQLQPQNGLPAGWSVQQ